MTETITQPVPDGTGLAPGNDLNRMLTPELKKLAQSMGVSGVSGMRKPDLLAAIRNLQAQAGAQRVGTASTDTQPQSQVPSDPAPPAQAPPAVPAAAQPPVGAGPDSRLTPSAEPPVIAAEANQAQSRPRPRRPRATRTRPTRTRATQIQADSRQAADSSQADSNQAPDSNQAGQTRPERSRPDRSQQPRERADSDEANQDSRNGSDADQGNQSGGNSNPGGEQDGDRQDRNRRRNRDRNRNRNNNTSNREQPNRENRNERSGRGDAPITEDDVLIPVAGILDILDNYAFVRTTGYLPGPNDVYVSMSMVKRNKLRKGDAVTGAIKQPDDSPAGRREKYNPLARIDTVNGTPADEMVERPEFGKLTPLYPQQRLRLETESNNLTTRIIDLVAPIGKGQRGLIVSPPKAGKTMVLQAIANGITTNHPECHLMVVLVDERPEEVTDMQRSVKGEVIASTFDRPADDHTTVAELAIERAKRLVELGHDVVVLLDSMTRLGRAYNLSAPASGRILSGGVDSAALYPPKKFFGAARNIENGGSLTILATALVETGSKMDEVIFEEFKGTGNMELKLDRRLADKRLFPAVDVDASGTRKEELLMAPEELKIVWKLRRVLHALDSLQAIETLLTQLRKTPRNYDFLSQVQKTTSDLD